MNKYVLSSLAEVTVLLVMMRDLQGILSGDILTQQSRVHLQEVVCLCDFERLIKLGGDQIELNGSTLVVVCQTILRHSLCRSSTGRAADKIEGLLDLIEVFELDLDHLHE